MFHPYPADRFTPRVNITFATGQQGARAGFAGSHLLLLKTASCLSLSTGEQARSHAPYRSPSKVWSKQNTTSKQASWLYDRIPGLFGCIRLDPLLVECITLSSHLQIDDVVRANESKTREGGMERGVMQNVSKARSLCFPCWRKEAPKE